MRIAFYNIQNLFFRHHLLLREKQSRNLQNWIEEMDQLVGLIRKGPSELNRIRELSFLLNFEKVDTLRYGLMRSRGSKIYLNSSDYPTMEKACFQNYWNGWVEIMNRPLSPVSVMNKARLISEVQPDILLLQEVEDRTSLQNFLFKFLKQYPGRNFNNSVVAPSINDLGLEHALMLKSGMRVHGIYPYADEKTPVGEYLFNRGCTLFKVDCPGNIKIGMLTVQFVPNGNTKDECDLLRSKQSLRVAEIYRDLIASGMKNIIVMGTFDAYSYCHSLAPLLQDTDLRSIHKHPNFCGTSDFKNSTYQRLGGYGNGINIRQKDYYLVSPLLFERIQKSGVNRKGMWSGVDNQWNTFQNIKEKSKQASGHPLLWADFNI